MADGTGLAIGATRLAAVVVDRAAVSRSPVLTRYPHRPPEVGVPAENPNLTERGLIFTDFVDRVGDPVGIVASDGTTHRAETLMVEALRALLHIVQAGRPAGPVAVSHPGHWRPGAVEALRAALAGSPEFTRPGAPPAVVSDAQAALTALARDPGVPTRGVIAVCDFGGTGTNLSLFDMARAAAPLAATVRHPDLSGDLIDQALLKHVIDGLSEAGTIDLSGTSAIGSLGRLRAQCRIAKEQLSTSAVASLTAELPGRRTDLRITRDELDDTLRAPLHEFADVMQEALQRNGIHTGDLVTVASIGGGARIPAVTTMLSERFRVPVITTARPELTAAIGAGLQAVRATVREGMTSVAPAALLAAGDPGPPQTDAPSSTFRALAWSDAENIPDYIPNYGDPAELLDGGDTTEAAYADGPRPSLQFIPATGAADAIDLKGPPAAPWFRKPLVLAGIGAVALLAAAGAAGLFLMRNDSAPAPSATTTPVTTATTPSPTTTPPPTSEPPPATQAPLRTVTRQAPAPRTQAPQWTPTPQQPQPIEELPPSEEPPTEEPPAPEEPAPIEEPPPTEPTFQGPVITIPGLGEIPVFPQPQPPPQPEQPAP